MLLQANFIPSCDSSCSYSYIYGDGSTTNGHFVTDTITLTDSTGTVSAIQGFYFGCGQNQTGNFDGADGLIGFGQGAVSLPSQMARIFSEVFSYCLVRRSAATTSTSTLQFGSTASSATGLTQTSILSVPANPTYYYVPMVGITVEGVDLGISASSFAINTTDSTGGVIFDSGTTFTTLDQSSIDAIVQVCVIFLAIECRPLLSPKYSPGGNRSPMVSRIVVAKALLVLWLTW